MNVAHATLRRRRWFSSVVRAGVLALETPPTRDGARWALHGHGVLDATAEADGAAWRERLSAEWRSLVETPGAVFELEPLRSPGALAGYAMKLRNAKSWAPGVRELDSERRAQVAKALRHRRLLVTWGGRQCRG
jgi:hypothetical protein